MSKQTEALKLALECIEAWDRGVNASDYWRDRFDAITAIREALAEQPAQQEPDRVKFERHWRKTRGDKKANRELPRHPLQPQTYIQDSANRHWVTWQAAVRSVSPPASKPWVGLTEEEIEKAMPSGIYDCLADPWDCGVGDGDEMRSIKKDVVRITRAIEAKLREKNNG